MAMRSFDTTIHLPSRIPVGSAIHEVLQRAFEQYRWFKPMRYGFLSLDRRLEPSRIDYGALVAFYEERKCLTVAAQADRDFIQIYASRSDAPSYTGKLTWVTTETSTKSLSWRTVHMQQVHEVMSLLDAPLAQAAAGTDFRSKTERLVHDGVSEVLDFSVRGYDEGLAGLFWRNFYGPPFTRMFGERLTTLPADACKELGNGIVLVQPYELPSQAGTPEGQARERELIAHLGPECFYDHEHHLRPTRVPTLAR